MCQTITQITMTFPWLPWIREGKLIKAILAILGNFRVTNLLPGKYNTTEQVWATGQGVICNQGV